MPEPIMELGETLRALRRKLEAGEWEVQHRLAPLGQREGYWPFQQPYDRPRYTDQDESARYDDDAFSDNV